MKFFRFKKFQITDDRSAMKVGTDSVILGAWVRSKHVNRVIDVGCGSGLLSLMIAQRFPEAIIHGVELDSLAVMDAQFNFENAPWASRLKVFNKDIRDFDKSSKYDLVISNPPFFKSSLLPPSQRRGQARHDQMLSLDELLSNVKELMNDSGIFVLVFPFDREGELMMKAEQVSLFPQRILHTRNKPNAIVKRSFVVFSFHKCTEVTIEEFSIRNNENEYSEAYKKLTADFYLNF